ncbi:MAG: hypothetical protein U1F76_24910 [Candidatus Competibacteraceae bacterium]
METRVKFISLHSISQVKTTFRMKSLILLLCLPVLWCCDQKNANSEATVSNLPANSQAGTDQRHQEEMEKLDKAIELIKTACGVGEAVTIKTNTQGGFQLFRKGGKGEVDFTFSKENIPLIARGLESSLQPPLQEQQRCMRAYIGRILDVILPLDQPRKIITNLTINSAVPIPNDGAYVDLSGTAQDFPPGTVLNVEKRKAVQGYRWVVVDSFNTEVQMSGQWKAEQVSIRDPYENHGDFEIRVVALANNNQEFAQRKDMRSSSLTVQIPAYSIEIEQCKFPSNEEDLQVIGSAYNMRAEENIFVSVSYRNNENIPPNKEAEKLDKPRWLAKFKVGRGSSFQAYATVSRVTPRNLSNYRAGPVRCIRSPR